MEWLEGLGIGQKQQLLYAYLLENGRQSALELSKGLNEQRTNIYLLVDELIKKRLVERDDATAVARFKATHPRRLQELFQAEQKQLAQHANKFRAALPELSGLYQLRTATKGLAYFEGVKGYRAALQDMLTTESEVCVFGTARLNDRPELWNILQNGLRQRASKKISTRMILDNTLRQRVSPKDLAQHRIVLKFWGDTALEGEIAIYGSTAVLTTYDETLVTLALKNPTIASSLQAIFDQAWKS